LAAYNIEISCVGSDVLILTPFFWFVVNNPLATASFPCSTASVFPTSDWRLLDVPIMPDEAKANSRFIFPLPAAAAGWGD